MTKNRSQTNDWVVQIWAILVDIIASNLASADHWEVETSNNYFVH